MTQQHIIYHAQCQDGFASAYAAWRKFGDNATYTAATYGNTPPELSGQHVTIVDFCYPRSVMESLNRITASLTVLDHHATIFKAMDGFCSACGTVRFDMQKSGARLTFEHFFPGIEVPELIQMVEDGDFYRFALPDSKNYLAALETVPHDFLAWDQVCSLSGAPRQSFIDQGKAVNKRIARYCESVLTEAVPFRIGTQTGLMVNAPRDISTEIGNLLATRSGTFGGCWHVRKDGLIKFSLRSNAPYEVKGLAEAFQGGGGHAQAAAFTLPPSRIGEVLSLSLDANV